MRSLRPMEMVAGLSILGSVLAVSVPAFVKNLHASRLAEPLDALKQVGQRASQLAALRGVAEAYPGPAPLTPSEIPSGRSVVDPPETWDHPTWKALGLRFEHAHYFAFSFDSKNDHERSTFTARAQADLDGDGLTSLFELSGEYGSDGEPLLYPIEIHREVE